MKFGEVSRIAPTALCALTPILLALGSATPLPATPPRQEIHTGPQYAVGPQYDTMHVYVEPGTMNSFIASWRATFGGSNTTPIVTDVTPTPSETESELVLSPVGTLSVFDFHTPIPYPFGAERTGLLMKDFDQGVQAARDSGAQVVVAPFPDPIGRDAIVEFPGGIATQLYWHTTPPSYAPLATIPENRMYVSPDGLDAFLRSYTMFTAGRVVSDDKDADAAQIGMPGKKYRRITIRSQFGDALVQVTDGHLPYPFGREMSGYAVSDLAAALKRAKAAGATVLWGPVSVTDRNSAVVKFPGGYVAEVHDAK
jgi:hypothetical protein